MPRNCIYNDKVARAHNFLNHQRSNREYYFDLMKKPQKSVNELVRSNLIVGSEYMRIELNDKQFLIVQFDHYDNEVVFHATGTFCNDVALNEKPSVQLWIWKSLKPKHKVLLADLSEQILLEYLLARYNVIGSENHVNLEGRTFWNEMASIVLEKAMYAYRYNRRTWSIHEIANHEELVTNRCDLWGEGADYTDVLLVLSDDEIFIK